MDAAFSRILRRVLVVLGGLGLGAFLGWSLGAPVLSAVLGCAAAVVASVWRDLRRAERLLDWLRGGQEGGAPREAGVWGELAYRVERALRQRDKTVRQGQDQLAQFLSAIEASPNGVLILDAQEQIVWCNRLAAQHFGLDPERDRLQRLTNLVRAPAFVEYLHEGNFSEPLAMNAPIGRARLSVLVQPYGQRNERLLLSQDITERESTEAMRRDFVANVSHEIRTPLTVLAGFVETLANLPLTEPERRRVLVLMEQQTQRMQTLVADLLMLAQLEGSPRPTADAWVPVQALLERALADALALSAGRHALRLEAGRADEAAEIAGHDSELLSAVGNLLSNAVRYTAEGGSISLSWVWRPDGGGEIVVSDAGIGIAREHLPRLTERFYRIDGSRSRDTGGTGLGLAIVKHVVQRHGGEIRIESEPGQGSSFSLVFPAARVRRGASGLAPGEATSEYPSPLADLSSGRPALPDEGEVAAVGGPRDGGYQLPGRV
jgi:two-component system, OmpR family, phosphate regulon sensor histidine kinase PhoR